MPTKPDYNSNLEQGHSRDCKTLNVGFYPDLHSDIKDTTAKVRESLYTFMDKDADFAGRVDGIIEYIDHNLTRIAYETVLPSLTRIQSLLQTSKLDDAEKLAFWTPIAECYSRVQSTLKDRILPLEERELVKVGDTIEVPVRIVSNRRGGYLFLPELPRFKYALERTNRDSGYKSRDHLSVNFSDDQKQLLSKELSGKIRIGETVMMQVKIVSEDYGMLTMGEVDIQAFLARESE